MTIKANILRFKNNQENAGIEVKTITIPLSNQSPWCDKEGIDQKQVLELKETLLAKLSNPNQELPPRVVLEEMLDLIFWGPEVLEQGSFLIGESNAKLFALEADKIEHKGEMHPSFMVAHLFIEHEGERYPLYATPTGNIFSVLFQEALSLLKEQACPKSKAFLPAFERSRLLPNKLATDELKKYLLSSNMKT